MIAFLKTWPGKVAIVLVVLAGVLLWARSDAVRDFKVRQRVETAEERLRHIHESSEVRDEIREMDDCDLLYRLLGRVRATSASDGTDVHRCGEGTAADPAGDGHLPGPQ